MLKCDRRNLEQRSRKNRTYQSPARQLEAQQPDPDARRLRNRFDHRFHNPSGQHSPAFKFFDTATKGLCNDLMSKTNADQWTFVMMNFADQIF